METFSPVQPAHHTRFRLTSTAATDFLDLTATLERLVDEWALGTGLLTIQTLHTTTGLLVNEGEPRLHDDFHATLARLAPLGVAYRHDDLARRSDVGPDEPRNGHAHCRALVLAPSVGLQVVHGRLLLGRWQRVFLVDLDGPREREVSIVALGATR